MRAKTWVRIGLLTGCCVAAWLEVHHLRSRPAAGPEPPVTVRQSTRLQYALLPESETAVYAKYFSSDPKSVQAWEPTVADIEGLEANLAQVSSLSEGQPGRDRQVPEPQKYLRQYVAVIESGKSIIFVNALCTPDQDAGDKWRKRLAVVADGGTCHWHASYDPSTGKFSRLTINDVG